MLSLRYSAGKVWLNFLCALIGGIAGIIAVILMLLPGVIKRATHTEPVLTIDSSGILLNPLGIGAIPWARIRATRISGIPWLLGLRLTIEYTGTAPRPGFMDKLNWGIQAKRKGEVIRPTIGFIDMTDQSISSVRSSLIAGAKVA